MSIPVRSLRLLPKSKTELDRISGNKGEIFYDSTSKSLRIFDGTILGGTLLNASVSVKETAPDNPTQGSLWFNSATGAFYIYYEDGTSNQWIANYWLSNFKCGRCGVVQCFSIRSCVPNSQFAKRCCGNTFDHGTQQRRHE